VLYTDKFSSGNVKANAFVVGSACNWITKAMVGLGNVDNIETVQSLLTMLVQGMLQIVLNYL
jgi:hypothetical protein